MDQQKMLDMVKALPGSIGLYIKDTATGEEISYNADLPVEAASVIKVLVMAEAFRQKEAGLIDFAAPVTVPRAACKPSCGALTYLHDNITVQVGDLVTLMIILSDNTATNLLIDMLGVANVNAMIASMGLHGTILNRKLFMPELAALGVKNYIAAGDLGRVMQLLLDGQVVSAEASAEMLRILGNQRLNGKMPFFLHSEGIKCAHKTGEDDGITHDVGVIYGKSTVIFCFVSQNTDVPEAELVLQRLAQMAVK